MKIYTKAGDAGETGLLGGERTPKASARIDAIGEVDELNSCLGMTIAEAPLAGLTHPLLQIQRWLFDLGGHLACPPGGKFALPPPEPSAIAMLERQIDEMTERLPPLKEFILPGGNRPAATLHHARSVCRRAERAVLRLHAQEPVSGEALAFLNRLSDWLFVAARAENSVAGLSDVPWKLEDSKK